jgi:hypothetical protein
MNVWSRNVDGPQWTQEEDEFQRILWEQEGLLDPHGEPHPPGSCGRLNNTVEECACPDGTTASLVASRMSRGDGSMRTWRCDGCGYTWREYHEG